MIEDLISYKEAAPVLCTRVCCQLHSVTDSSLVSRSKESWTLGSLYLGFAVNEIPFGFVASLTFAESPVQQTGKTTSPHGVESSQPVTPTSSGPSEDVHRASLKQ